MRWQELFEVKPKLCGWERSQSSRRRDEGGWQWGGLPQSSEKKWKCNEKSKSKACDLVKDWKCLRLHIGGEPPLLESLVRTKVCKKLLIATLWPTSSSSQAWPRSGPTCFLKRSLNQQRLNAHMFYLSCLVFVFVSVFHKLSGLGHSLSLYLSITPKAFVIVFE